MCSECIELCILPTVKLFQHIPKSDSELYLFDLFNHFADDIASPNSIKIYNY